MKKLVLSPISSIDELADPSGDYSGVISLQSPALEVYTDLTKVDAQVVDVNTSMQEVRRLMIQAHVRLKFVVDKDGHFIGVISTDDLIESKIVRQVALGMKREELTVADLMRPKQTLVALDINAIKTATIRDIVELLKDSHQQHCLVQDAVAHKICGIFSASDISRKMKLPIEIYEKSSFSEVFKNVA